MRSKNLSILRPVLTIFAVMGGYALVSFLGACLCLCEAAGEDEIGVVYFLMGLLSTFIAVFSVRHILRMKKIWAALAALPVMLLVVFLCEGNAVAPARIWIYPGCGAGALAALAMGGGRKRAAAGTGRKRRKK